MAKRPTSILKQERSTSKRKAAESRRAKSGGLLNKERKHSPASTRALAGPTAEREQSLGATFSQTLDAIKRHWLPQQEPCAEDEEQSRNQHDQVRPDWDSPESDVKNAVWGCHSVVDRQAAAAVKALLSAQKRQRKGVSLKALTLAPKVQAKKATFRVTCQTLQHLPALQHVLARTKLLQTHR